MGVEVLHFQVCITPWSQHFAGVNASGVEGGWCAADPFFSCVSRLSVYSPCTQQVEVTVTTDPYSRSLSADGLRTQACSHPPVLPFFIRVSFLASC
jgi:hypothetical protein